MIVFPFVTVCGKILYPMACFDNVPLSSSEGQTWNCVTLASVTEVWLLLSVLTGGPHLLMSAPPRCLPLTSKGVERVPVKDVKLHQEQHVSILHVGDRWKPNNLISQDIIDSKQLQMINVWHFITTQKSRYLQVDHFCIWKKGSSSISEKIKKTPQHFWQ